MNFEQDDFEEDNEHMNKKRKKKKPYQAFIIHTMTLIFNHYIVSFHVGKS